MIGSQVRSWFASALTHASIPANLQPGPLLVGGCGSITVHGASARTTRTPLAAIAASCRPSSGCGTFSSENPFIAETAWGARSVKETLGDTARAPQDARAATASRTIKSRRNRITEPSPDSPLGHADL